MTCEKVGSIKPYKNYCNCGGYAAGVNGRNPEHPHMSWCAQCIEFEERQLLLAAEGEKK